MLASEADRRGPTIISGLEELAASEKNDPDRIEQIRVEAHGLKGAAMVVGEERLAELARLLEQSLAGAKDSGQIAPAAAATLIAGTSAFSEGAHAAAEGGTEPPSVGESLDALG
jgi:HPt (histidine-containing phosphotransfer) domain-containing protein